MTANLDTARLSGPVGKGISIYTNDPSRPNARVAVRAIVQGSVQLLPGYESLLSNRAPDTRTGWFLVRQERDETGTLKISDMRGSADWITYDAWRLDEKRPPTGDGLPTGFPGDWIVEVSYRGSAPYGRSKESVTFATGLPREPEVELTLVVDMQPPVTLNEQEIEVQAGQTKTVLASLRRDLVGAELKVSSSEGVEVVSEKGLGRFLKIHITADADGQADPLVIFEVGSERQAVPINVLR